MPGGNFLLRSDWRAKGRVYFRSSGVLPVGKLPYFYG